MVTTSASWSPASYSPLQRCASEPGEVAAEEWLRQRLGHDIRVLYRVMCSLYRVMCPERLEVDVTGPVAAADLVVGPWMHAQWSEKGSAVSRSGAAVLRAPDGYHGDRRRYRRLWTCHQKLVLLSHAVSCRAEGRLFANVPSPTRPPKSNLPSKYSVSFITHADGRLCANLPRLVEGRPCPEISANRAFKLSPVLAHQHAVPGRLQ